MDTGTTSPTGNGQRDGRQGVEPVWHRFRTGGQGRIDEIVNVVRRGGEHARSGTVGAVLRRRPM